MVVVNETSSVTLGTWLGFFAKHSDCYCLVTKSGPANSFATPWDCSPPASSVHGILQARILKWVAISFSRGSFWPKDWTHDSCIGRWILYHWATWEAQSIQIHFTQKFHFYTSVLWNSQKCQKYFGHKNVYCSIISKWQIWRVQLCKLVCNHSSECMYNF